MLYNDGNDKKKIEVRMDNITNKARIAKFVWDKKGCSKQDISKGLGLSMPTVLQNVNELIEDGILQEGGAYKSSVGRKAKMIIVRKDSRYAAGMNITKNHVSFVLIDFQGEIIEHERIRIEFEDQTAYYMMLKATLEEILDKHQIDRNSLLGVGISLPGGLNSEHTVLKFSRVLHVNNLNLQTISKIFDYPVAFENDAASALLSEMDETTPNTAYFSLSSTAGGALWLNGSIYIGSNSRSGDIGHMILEKNGRPCYCGKKGCFNAYCSSDILADMTDGDLDLFFKKLEEGDPELQKAWDEYLDYLSIAIANVRTLCDCNIILGGYVGAYIDQYLHALIQHITSYYLFEQTTPFIKTCDNRTEASALGIAACFIKKYLCEL